MNFGQCRGWFYFTESRKEEKAVHGWNSDDVTVRLILQMLKGDWSVNEKVYVWIILQFIYFTDIKGVVVAGWNTK